MKDKASAASPSQGPQSSASPMDLDVILILAQRGDAATGTRLQRQNSVLPGQAGTLQLCRDPGRSHPALTFPRSQHKRWSQEAVGQAYL